MKRVFLVLLCIVVTFSGISCSKKKDSGSSDGRMAVDERLEDMAKLQVYAVEGDSMMEDLRDAFTLEMFASKAASMEITWFEDYETLYKTMTTELLGGGGPDVIFFYPEDFESFYSLLKNNILEDINPYLEESQINITKFNEKALEAGVYDGKRMFIPLSYSLDLFLTNDSAINGFSFDDITNIEELIERHDEYIQMKNGEAYNFYNKIPLSVFLEEVGIPVVDYEKQTIAWDEKQLKYYVDLYKKLSAYMITDDSVYQEYSDPEIGIIMEGDVAFINSAGYVSPGFIKYSTTLLKALAGKDTANLYSLSELAGNGGTTAYAGLSVAINHNSKHKVEAAKLIKTVLDKSMQNRDEIMFPVLTSSMKVRYTWLTTRDDYNLRVGGVDTKIIAFTDDELARYQIYIENITNPVWSDYRTRTLIDNSFESYLLDQADWQRTIKKATSALRMYLTE